MVNAQERSSDEAQQEKGNCVKGTMTADKLATILAAAKASGVSPTAAVVEDSKAISARTQLSIARFGKAARHPLCRAALNFWRQDAEFRQLKNNAASFEAGVLNSVKEEKKQTVALYRQFCKEGKDKEAAQAAGFVQKFNKLLMEAQACYDAMVRQCESLKDFRAYAAMYFDIEKQRAKGGARAQRALRRLQKRWNDGKVSLKDGDLREIGILEMLHARRVNAVFAKDGAVAGWVEALTVGNSPLSDEVWEGRLTVREAYSHLLANYGPIVAADSEGKEIRRTFKRLGIQPAEDKPGRKWKGAVPAKQKPKQPVGRPRKAKLITVGDDETADGDVITSEDKLDYLQGTAKTTIAYKKWSWQPTAEFEQKEAAIARELAKLKRTREKARLKM
jgi:hypothetical protein